MKPATYIRITDKVISVSGENHPEGTKYSCRPEIINVLYNQALQSFSDSFVQVSNPEIALRAITAPIQNKVTGLYDEGTYPVQGLEFKVREQWRHNRNAPWHEVGLSVPFECERRTVAIVSLAEPSRCKIPTCKSAGGNENCIGKGCQWIEPSKEVHYSENPELGGRFTERLGEKTYTKEDVLKIVGSCSNYFFQQGMKEARPHSYGGDNDYRKWFAENVQ